MITFKQTYGSSQSGTTIITPTAGKKVYVWAIIIDSSGDATVEFSTSAITIGSVGYGGRTGKCPADKEGAVDEVVSLTCDANTDIAIMYDEL